MAIEMATQQEMESIAALERFALALRFHGYEMRAEAVEHKTEIMRLEIWARLGSCHATRFLNGWRGALAMQTMEVGA